jgi:hypothetical protein
MLFGDKMQLHKKPTVLSSNGFQRTRMSCYCREGTSPAWAAQKFAASQGDFPACVHIYYIIYQTQFYIDLFMVLNYIVI